MIGIVRDTWRAVLVLVVGALLMEMHRRPEVQVVQMPAPPAWQPAPVQWAPPAAQVHERPLRRFAVALTELGDSVLGVVR